MATVITANNRNALSVTSCALRSVIDALQTDRAELAKSLKRLDEGDVRTGGPSAELSKGRWPNFNVWPRRSW